MGWVEFTGACVLAVAETAIEPTDTGWIEALDLEVRAEGRCPHIDVHMPPGSQLTSLKSKVVLSDGTKHRLDADRQQRITRDIDGHGWIRFFTPEMIAGDTARFSIERTHGVGPYQWSVSPDVAFASLEAPGLPSPPENVRSERGSWWTATPGDAVAYTLDHPSGPGPSTKLTAAEDVRASVALALGFKGRDPMIALYPGGGSTLTTTWTVNVPGDEERAFVLPVPPDASDLDVTGPHELRDDSVLLLGSSEPHVVRWITPDAPVYGERLTLEGAVVERQTVEMPDARIRWQDDQTWWVGSLGMRTLVPERSRFVEALNRRFRRAAIPEPAIPQSLRGVAVDWTYIATLVTELDERASIAPLPRHPLFPRRLIKARKTGALTSVEAAIILWVQAGQIRVPASWAIARPATEGPGWHTSAAGYDQGVVAFNLAGETRWVDPGCLVCAPFELRPELEGAAVLAPIANRTPGPRRAKVTVVDGESRTVTLEGPAAVALRHALFVLPSASRRSWLANHLGGPDASVERIEGLTDLGHPMTIVLKGASSVPWSLEPGIRAWVGDWSWTHSAQRDDVQSHSSAALDWTASSKDDLRTETLSLKLRDLDDEALEAFDAVRTAAPPRPISEDAEPEVDPDEESR